MEVERLVFNPFQENTYVAWNGASGECVIIDAGNNTPAEGRALVDFIEQRGLKPVAAVNTHGHIDHILGVDFVMKKWGVPWFMGAGDAFLVETAANQAAMFGMSMGSVPQISRELSEGEKITLGNSSLSVISTPGHTPGHICLLGEDGEGRKLFTGDTLFRESIGRTDLPGGDYSWIMRSIIDKIMPLGSETEIFPGHGPASTIGHEALYNPFITEVLNGEVGI